MPRYYFHLHSDEGVLVDQEGRDFPDNLAMAAAAIRDVRAMLSEDARDGSIDLAQRLEITDASGDIVHRIAFADAVDVTLPGEGEQGVPIDEG